MYKVRCKDYERMQMQSVAPRGPRTLCLRNLNGLDKHHVQALCSFCDKGATVLMGNELSCSDHAPKLLAQEMEWWIKWALGNSSV